QNTVSVQQVSVSAGKAALAWSIRRQTDSPWLKFSSGSGTTPATVDISVDSTGLRPGHYSALAYFTAAGGTNSLFIVTLTVTDARAGMLLDRDSLLFEAVEGATTAPAQPVRIYNSGAAPLLWQLSVPPVDDQRRSVNWVRASLMRDAVQ